MPQRKCCVPTCTSSLLEGAVLHAFPNPSLCSEKFKIWVNNAGLTDEDSDHVFINRRICHLHFEKVYHYPKNRLSRLAVPTLHVPGVPQNATCKRPVPMVVEELQPTTSTSSSSNITKILRIVKMNEIDLIKEVEKRAILYDKSVSGFNKTKLRDDAWKDVSVSLKVCESECKKRWRSLRDSFIKLQRTHGGRTRWPYHQAMRFLLPHIEPKDNGSKKEAEDSDAEEEMRQRAIQCLPDLSFGQDTKYDDDDEDSQPSPKKARQNSTDNDDNPCQCNRTDPDELFLLSCAPTLKRLNAKQNALARLKIQQVLLESEFGGQMDLPYVTPASDCGFDAVE